MLPETPKEDSSQPEKMLDFDTPKPYVAPVLTIPSLDLDLKPYAPSVEEDTEVQFNTAKVLPTERILFSRIAISISQRV
jgi:hypothetical protein